MQGGSKISIRGVIRVIAELSGGRILFGSRSCKRSGFHGRKLLFPYLMGVVDRVNPPFYESAQSSHYLHCYTLHFIHFLSVIYTVHVKLKSTTQKPHRTNLRFNYSNTILSDDEFCCQKGKTTEQNIALYLTHAVLYTCIHQLQCIIFNRNVTCIHSIQHVQLNIEPERQHTIPNRGTDWLQS